LFGGGSQQRRRLEGFIDPEPEIAIDEQLLAQQSGEIISLLNSTASALTHPD
jgi:hypothetical protein